MPDKSQPKRPPKRTRKTNAKPARHRQRPRGKGGGTRTPAPRPTG